MPKITQIQYDNKTQRAQVYIDYRFCASIRQNIWEELGLREGSEISCAQLHQKEASVWKRSSQSSSMYISKQAINRVMEWVRKYIPNLNAKVIDFRYIYDNGDNSGLAFNYSHTRNDQNISLTLKATNKEIITLEVMGVELQRGINYWARENKLLYAQSQFKRDGWVVLYYKYPKEVFVWIKPEHNKQYKSEELIRSSKTRFIAFNDRSPEVYSSKGFCEYIQKKIEGMVSDISSRENGLSSLVSKEVKVVEITDKKHS